MFTTQSLIELVYLVHHPLISVRTPNSGSHLQCVCFLLGARLPLQVLG